jgi:hypothetical protein
MCVDSPLRGRRFSEPRHRPDEREMDTPLLPPSLGTNKRQVTRTMHATSDTRDLRGPGGPPLGGSARDVT